MHLDSLRPERCARFQRRRRSVFTMSSGQQPEIDPLRAFFVLDQTPQSWVVFHVEGRQAIRMRMFGYSLPPTAALEKRTTVGGLRPEQSSAHRAGR